MEAEHPLVVVGKAAAATRCEDLLLQFIERSKIPFLPTPMGRGLLRDDHPLCVAPARSRALREATVVLLLGCRLNWILHFGTPPRWSADAKFIAVDVDKEALRNSEVKQVS